MKKRNSTLVNFNKVLSKGNEVEILRFYFNHSAKYVNHKVTKAKSGVYVKNSTKKIYAELTLNKDFILLYPVYGNKIGQCIGEIILDDYISQLKRIEELLNL